MILQCPACDARFLVNDALIPREGREVRCGKCKHSWHVAPSEVPLDLPPELTPAPEASPVFANFEEALASATPDEAEMMAMSATRETRLPAVQVPFKPKPFIWSAVALALLVCILAPIAFYPQWKDGPLGGVYRMFGWHPSDGLAFSDVSFEKAKLETKTRFIITGNITNRAKEKRLIDEVRVMLKDAEGEEIWSRSFAVKKELKPGDVYPFDIPGVETAFGDKVKTVMLDMGNSYELMIR